MNSDTKIKRRIRKVIRRRKGSNNMNYSSVSTVPGSYKRRISTLSRNNKTLAQALQDARCELSHKQDLLKDCTENMSKMMFVRIKMLDMYSTLKSFTKNFEEALNSLQMKDKKWPNLGLKPLDFKDKKKLAFFEALQEESESIHVDQRVESPCEMRENLLCTVVNNMRSNFDNFPMEEQAEESSKQYTVQMGCGFENEDNQNSKSERLSLGLQTMKNMEVLPVRNVYELTETSEIEDCSSEVIKSQDATPKLDISSINSDANREVSCIPKPRIVSENVNSLVTWKDNSKDSDQQHINPKTLIQEKNSKIPRFQDFCRKNKEILVAKEIHNKNKILCKKDTCITKSEKHKIPDRRETFVVPPKNLDNVPDLSKTPKSYSESPCIHKEVPNISENTNVVGKCRRKTFIKMQGEGIKPQTDRRKTYIKAFHETKKSTPVKNRRGTFTIPINKRVIGEKSASCENFNLVNKTFNSADNMENVIVLSSDDKEKTETLSVPVNFSTTDVSGSLMANKNFKSCEHNLKCANVSDVLQMDLENVEVDKEALILDEHDNKIIDEERNLINEILNRGVNISQDNSDPLLTTEINYEHSLKCADIRDNTNVLSKRVVSSDLQIDLENVKVGEQSLNFDELDNEIIVEDKNLKSNDILSKDVTISQDNSDPLENSTPKKSEEILEQKLLFSSSSSSSSSDLDYDIVSENLFDSIPEVSSIKHMPVRRCISQSKKVFVFNAGKRKSILKKNIGNNSECSLKINNENMCQTVKDDSVNINKAHVQDVEIDFLDAIINKKKSLRFATDDKMSKSDNVNNEEKEINESNANMLNKNEKYPVKIPVTEDNWAKRKSILKKNIRYNCESSFNINSENMFLSVTDGSVNINKPHVQDVKMDLIDAVISKKKSLKFATNDEMSKSDNVNNEEKEIIESDANILNKNEKYPVKISVTEDNVCGVTKNAKGAKRKRNNKNLNTKDVQQKQKGISYIEEDSCISKYSDTKNNEITGIFNISSVNSTDPISVLNEQAKKVTGLTKKTNNTNKKNKVIEAVCLDGGNERNSKKSLKIETNVEHIPSIDDILVDENIPPLKKRRGRKRNIPENKVLSVELNADTDNVESEFLEKKSKTLINKLSKKKNKKTPGKTVVYAEIHAPPPFLDNSPNKISEGSKVTGISNMEVSVVLHDIFLSNDINEFVSCGNEISKSKMDAPFISNGSTVDKVTKDYKELSSESNADEINFSKQRRAGKAVSYKEPSLNKKLRR